MLARILAPGGQPRPGPLRMALDEGPHRPFGGEALGHRVQRIERTIGLMQAAARHPVGQRPHHPARQAGGRIGRSARRLAPGHRAGRRQRRLQRVAGGREVVRQHPLQMALEHRRQMLHPRLELERLQPGTGLGLEGVAVQPGQHPCQMKSELSDGHFVEQVPEGFGHDRSIATHALAGAATWYRRLQCGAAVGPASTCRGQPLLPNPPSPVSLS